MLDFQNVDAAAILVTADLPDEALLDLLDLDPAWPGLACTERCWAGTPKTDNGHRWICQSHK